MHYLTHFKIYFNGSICNECQCTSTFHGCVGFENNISNQCKPDFLIDVAFFGNLYINLFMYVNLGIVHLGKKKNGIPTNI